MAFKCLDEPMTWRRLELARINLSREFKEGSGILLEVMNVEHGLKKLEKKG